MFPMKYAGDDDIVSPYSPQCRDSPAFTPEHSTCAMVRAVNTTGFPDQRLKVISRIAQTLLELAVDPEVVSPAEKDDLLDQFKSVAELVVNDLNLEITKCEGPELECRIIPYLP